ncbi:MAG: peptidoglycan-binding protein [Acidimicrobiia bacterium]
MRDSLRLVAASMAAVLALSGCSLFDSGKAIDPVAAQAQFCSDIEAHVDAVGRYGGLFQDVELTVGDVKTAEEELKPSLEAVEDSASIFRQAVELDPTSGLTIELVEPATISAVQAAEQAFADASDIDDRTAVVDAGVEFSSAAYQLEVAWTRLFVDAGCLEGDERAQAEAQQWVSDYVSAIQTDLRTIGYYQGDVDGLYGPKTIEAVERFQEDNGLPVTGLVDPPTQASLQIALAGRSSAEVGGLQAILIATGYYSGTVDGVWSPAVESALIDLQNDLGVPATGAVDAATLRAMGEALAGADQEPSVPTTEPSAPETTGSLTATTTTAPAETTTTVATSSTVPTRGSLLDILAEAGQFNVFLAGVETAGLTEVLSGAGPYTIFAPTDEAFAATTLPDDPEALAEIILHHVVDGALSGFDVQAAESLTSLQGGELAVGADQGIITLNGVAGITIANIDADNGVAHAINAVLLPSE